MFTQGSVQARLSHSTPHSATNTPPDRAQSPSKPDVPQHTYIQCLNLQTRSTVAAIEAVTMPPLLNKPVSDPSIHSFQVNDTGNSQQHPPQVLASCELIDKSTPFPSCPNMTPILFLFQPGLEEHTLVSFWPPRARPHNTPAQVLAKLTTGFLSHVPG